MVLPKHLQLKAFKCLKLNQVTQGHISKYENGAQMSLNSWQSLTHVTGISHLTDSNDKEIHTAPSTAQHCTLSQWV